MIYTVAIVGLILVAIAFVWYGAGYVLYRYVLDRPNHTRKDGGRDWRNF